MGISFSKPPVRASETAREEVCGECGGTGQIRSGEGMRFCRCRIQRLVAAAVAPFGTMQPLASDVVQNAYGPMQEATKGNAIIRGPWATVGPYVRLGVAMRTYEAIKGGKDFPFRVVTDAELLQGAFSRPTGGDDITETHYDMVDRIWDLTIVRLGFLGRPHAAAAGVLYEALRKREHLRKPTWLIEDAATPFDKGCHSWDPRVGEYVSTNFTSIAITEDS